MMSHNSLSLNAQIITKCQVVSDNGCFAPYINYIWELVPIVIKHQLCLPRLMPAFYWLFFQWHSLLSICAHRFVFFSCTFHIISGYLLGLCSGDPQKNEVACVQWRGAVWNAHWVHENGFSACWVSWIGPSEKITYM